MASETTPSSSPPLLGTVLVTSGNGLLGQHLIHVLELNTTTTSINHNHLHLGATYHTGSITPATTNTLLSSTKPTVIFHLASQYYNSLSTQNGERYFHNTNIKATEILLTRAAATDSSVKAFVFASTIDTYSDLPHENVDETHALWDSSSKNAG
ncbi:hypothetical protein G7Y89_g5144 [Cudoniella acicularis]|uniref:NAD-dependent epimerase/dehydratase domain-containing protein n=1 Tax=Cudoniella acicularis TaxID=354080 RepID=A0A8H4RN19_9HELO|nr:hypothetical protein G7Y89_g5144 [Cudoniella acicularis]